MRSGSFWRRGGSAGRPPPPAPATLWSWKNLGLQGGQVGLEHGGELLIPGIGVKPEEVKGNGVVGLSPQRFGDIAACRGPSKDILGAQDLGSRVEMPLGKSYSLAHCPDGQTMLFLNERGAPLPAWGALIDLETEDVRKKEGGQQERVGDPGPLLDPSVEGPQNCEEAAPETAGPLPVSPQNRFEFGEQ